MLSETLNRAGWIRNSGRALLLSLSFMVVMLPVGSGVARGESGEWIELPTLKESGSETVTRIAEPVEVTTGAEELGRIRSAAGESEPVIYDDPTVYDTTSSPSTPIKGHQPPLNLPRRFHWQGRQETLGLVGYVYLGDCYFVEENDYESAATAYRYALEIWPDCGPLLTRMDLLQVFMGDWLTTAENMQVGFDEGLPPAIHREYGLKEDTPLLSNRISDLPAVPAILFRLALGYLNQSETVGNSDPALAYLKGRLLAHLGEYDHALGALEQVALNDDASPWNFQAASQRAALYLATWQPEQAYMNLLRARSLIGEHPALLQRLAELKSELTLQMDGGQGDVAQERVRVIGQQGRGRWVIDSPSRNFVGRVGIVTINGASETDTHLLYRGRDYWLMTTPLGAEMPDWQTGQELTLIGEIAYR